MVDNVEVVETGQEQPKQQEITCLPSVMSLASDTLTIQSGATSLDQELLPDPKIKTITDITSKKYDELIQKIDQLPLEVTGEELKELLDLLFKNAIDEPEMHAMYANLCERLSTLTITKSNEENSAQEEVTSKQLLLKRSTQEFISGVFADATVEECAEKTEECQDFMAKILLVDKLEDAKQSACIKALSTMK